MEQYREAYGYNQDIDLNFTNSNDYNPGSDNNPNFWGEYDIAPPGIPTEPSSLEFHDFDDNYENYFWTYPQFHNPSPRDSHDEHIDDPSVSQKLDRILMLLEKNTSRLDEGAKKLDSVSQSLDENLIRLRQTRETLETCENECVSINVFDGYMQEYIPHKPYENTLQRYLSFSTEGELDACDLHELQTLVMEPLVYNQDLSIIDKREESRDEWQECFQEKMVEEFSRKIDGKKNEQVGEKVESESHEYTSLTHQYLTSFSLSSIGMLNLKNHKNRKLPQSLLHNLASLPNIFVSSLDRRLIFKSGRNIILGDGKLPYNPG